ncbi:MAG: YbaK/EbsC family protein [Candidatus Aenigmarchaeota archaeon]|nr:YbaK/EbsC family protein [Candidatus Aenigmarchaeota archaeon]
MVSVYDKIKNYFYVNKVSYREIKHTAGASVEDYHKALGCRWEQQLKCLLLKTYTDSREEFVVLTIPAQKRADLKSIKGALNAKKIRMATREELKSVTGCGFGELPPVGKIFGIKLLLDKDFLDEKEAFMNAGRVDVSFVVSPLDLQRLENPQIV